MYYVYTLYILCIVRGHFREHVVLASASVSRSGVWEGLMNPNYLVHVLPNIQV